MSPRSRGLATAFGALLWCTTAAAQTTGQIVARVVASADSSQIAGATATVLRETGDTIATGRTDASGDVVFIGLPPQTYRVLVRTIGYRPTEVRGVLVRSGATARLTITLPPAAVDLPTIEVVVEARPLLEPDVSVTRQVVTRTELASAPVQDLSQVLELRTGVSDGHFRGGRIGQETFVIDGVEVKDQLAGSRGGIGFSLAPSAVQEISVYTSGFTADQPSALSGVVTLVSRSGPTDRWFGRIEAVTDEWAPSGLTRGYVRTGATAGGPIGGATAFLDFLAIGRADADPRVKGLTCLPVDFPCPATRAVIPHQEGDRYYAFGRLDVPLGASLRSSVSLSRNRDQHELYSTRFKYALRDYLAERETANLATLQLDGLFASGGSHASRFTARVAFGRLDRFLGVPDATQPTRLGRFLLGDLRFRGEAFVRSPTEEQVASGRTIPGYVPPSDAGLGGPYGIFGSDLFVTDGTSGIAEWSRSDFADMRVDVQTVVSPRLDLRTGGSFKLYRIEAYQHATGGLAGSAPNYVRFHPRTVAGWIHGTLYAFESATIDLGVRVEGFQPQLAAPTDRADLTAPVVQTDWQLIVHPRIGFAMPLAVVGLDRAAVRWNFGRFSQPPDFQFFFDQSLDDSLNTAVRRQGNPYLSFERATAYEVGLDYLLTDATALRVTAYAKDLTGLTTSGIGVSSFGTTFTNLDFGRVQGMEIRLDTRLDERRTIEIGYALQKAVGVVSTAFDSTTTGGGSGGTVEIPLQFDRRHSIDLNVLWPLPFGIMGALGGTAASGYPVPGAAEERLPWGFALAARFTRVFALGGASVRLIAEGRNLLRQANLVTARPGGGVLPDVGAIEARAAQETAGARPIPRESPWYLPGFDADLNGILDRAEQGAARRAALFDAAEPTLFYGEALQIRLGVEIGF
ncbi:MAG: TonB-dependent receptor [Gemmatimonadota bacterium]|nr:TonB-dependent receptor [Gemmatimonadota bacterium]